MTRKQLSQLFEKYVRARDLAHNGYSRWAANAPSRTAEKARDQFERRADEADELAEQIRKELSQ